MAKRRRSRQLGECPKSTPGHRITLCQKPPKTIGQIAGPDDACRILRNTANADRESLYTLHLDAGNHVIGVEEVAKGTLTSTQTSARELFKGAIVNNAAAIIVAHNHPSGRPDPSQADVDITRNLVTVGKLLGIPVLDHVIVAKNGCTSLRTSGAAQFDGAKRGRRRRRR